VSPFTANNGQNPRMGFEMRKKGKVEDRSHTGNAIAGSTQSRDRLGKGGSKNDKMPTHMWKE